MTMDNQALTLEETAPAEGEFSTFSTDRNLETDVSYKFKPRKKPSLFTVITGPRGSLKTLLLTRLACNKLRQCLYLRYTGIKKHVWSNYPIGFFYRSRMDNKVYYLKPEPLNMESFYTFDAGLADGWVFIDEIDQWYDRQDWAAITQKLTNAVITQIRKRDLSLYATTQNFNWLNARAQFQTDTLINCREAAFTPWGRQNRLQMGYMSFLTLKDLSGVNTGYQYAENFRTYSTKLTHGERYWDKYDTNFQFDPTETKKKFSLKRDSTIITLGEGGYKIQSRPDGSEGMSSKANPDVSIFSHVIEDMRDAGYTNVKASDIWFRAGQLGWQGRPQDGGSILGILGFARNKGEYNLGREPDINESEGDLNNTHTHRASPIPTKKGSKRKLKIK